MRIARRHPEAAWAALLGAIVLVSLFVRDVGIDESSTMGHGAWFAVAAFAVAVVVFALVLGTRKRRRPHAQ